MLPCQPFVTIQINAFCECRPKAPRRAALVRQAGARGGPLVAPSDVAIRSKLPERRISGVPAYGQFNESATNRQLGL